MFSFVLLDRFICNFFIRNFFRSGRLFFMSFFILLITAGTVQNYVYKIKLSMWSFVCDLFNTETMWVGSLGHCMFWGTRATNFSIYTTKMEGAGPKILGTGAKF